MKFVQKWLDETGSNPNQLAKQLKIDRPLIDRWLSNSAETRNNPQSRFDIRKMRELRKLMKLSVAEFYTKLENEFTE